MEWSMISVKYPEAWKLLIDFHDSDKNVGLIDHPTVWAWEGTDISVWELRHLYDFFDENDVYVRIIPQVLAKKVDKGFDVRDRFMFGISGYKDYWQKALTMFDVRYDCEKSAFLKAFEILEEKLK